MRRLWNGIKAAPAFAVARAKEPSTYAGLAAAVSGGPPFPGQGYVVAGCGIAAFIVREGHRAAEVAE